MNEQDDLYGDDDGAQRVGNGPTNAPAQGKLENVTGLMKSPKTSRVLIVTGAVVLLAGALTVVKIVSSNRQREAAVPAALSGAAVGSPGSLQPASNPALARSDDYQKIVASASAQRASDALASGQSAQPLATTVESALKPAPTPAELAASAAAAERDRQQAAAAAAALSAAHAAASPQPGVPVPAAQPDPAYQQMMTNAQSAMTQLMASRSRGAMVVSFADPSQTQAGMTAAQSTNSSQASIQPATQPQAAAREGQTAQQYTLIGAGVIESARLDTAVNTDIVGDFGATLLTGPYAGAKLLGTVQRKGDMAQLNVTMLSLPKQGVSLPARAVILDANSAEAATATDVDRKLVVKYGVKPLASGFAAVADYLKNTGTTVVVNGETVTTTQPELTGKRMGHIIAGSAAQQVNADANALDTTPTARVRKDTIVGVFFTQDVIYTPKR